MVQGRVADARPGAVAAPQASRRRIERHHVAVLVDAVLAQRAELEEHVDVGQDLLSEAGEHVFVS